MKEAIRFLKLWGEAEGQEPAFAAECIKAAEALEGRDRELAAKAEELRAALARILTYAHRIQTIRWGYDGDCGADAEAATIEDIAKSALSSEHSPWRPVAEERPKLGPDDANTPVYTFDGKTVREDEWCGIWDGSGILGCQKVDEWFDYDDEHGGRSVTHWMPRLLPTPPTTI